MDRCSPATLDVHVAELSSVRIGSFRAPREHPRFRDSGPTQGWLVVFPRTRVWIQHAGRAPVLADPSRAMLYNRGQEYRRMEIDDAGDRCEWFSFSPELVAKANARFDPSAIDRVDRPFTSTHASVDARTYARQRAIFHHACAARDASRAVRFDPLFVEEGALDLLARVVASGHHARPYLRAPSRSRTSRQHAELVDAVKQLVGANLGDSMPLARIARAAGSSPFHVARVFQAQEGQGVHAYLTQLRLRASLERVVDGEDLTALALDLGFSSHSHFTVAFSRAFGEAPSAFRASVSSKKVKAAARRDRSH